MAGHPRPPPRFKSPPHGLSLLMSWPSPETPGGGPDEVGFGSARPPGRRWPRWPLVLAGTAVIAVAVVLALGRHPARPAPARTAGTVTQARRRPLRRRAGCGLLW